MADVGLFGARERETDGIAECVDNAVNLGAKSAARRGCTPKPPKFLNGAELFVTY